MNKKLIIILASIIVLLLGVGITIYALTSGDEVKPADAPKDKTECPKDTDTRKHTCDADGNVIKREYYDDSGNLEWYYINKYDDGNLIKAEWHDADGNLERYVKYEYDADGNRIKTEHYDADDNLREYFKSEYDADGNVIKYEEYDADGELVNTYSTN